MRVTSKGEVTIPQDVRRRLRIEAGNEVDFVIDRDAVRLVRRDPGTGIAVVASMRGRARVSTSHAPMTTDQVMALTRGEA